jgi:hypothetical protein
MVAHKIDRLLSFFKSFHFPICKEPWSAVTDGSGLEQCPRKLLKPQSQFTIIQSCIVGRST